MINKETDVFEYVSAKVREKFKDIYMKRANMIRRENTVLHPLFPIGWIGTLVALCWQLKMHRHRKY